MRARARPRSREVFIAPRGPAAYPVPFHSLYRRAFGRDSERLPTGSGILIRWPCKGGCPLIPGRWLLFSPFIYFRGIYLSISIFSSKGFVRLLCARVCELLYAFFGNVYFRSVLGSDYDRPRMKLVLRVDETVGVVFTVCRMTGAWVEWAFVEINTRWISLVWLFWWSCVWWG